MPYYMGDYYVGDPGFFSAIARLGKGILGLGGFGKAPRVLQAAPAAAGVAAGPLARRMEIGTQMARRAVGIVRGHPVLSAAAAAGAVGAISERMGRGAGVAEGLGMRGFHVSKKTGRVVRNRRMHVTNPRALRRAIRRCTGFARLAKRVLRFTSPRPPRGRPYFRRRHKKRV